MSLTYEISERNWARAMRKFSKSARRREYIYVAENDTGELIGIAMGGPSSKHPLYSGEIYLLYLLPAYYRQGIGRQLLASVVERLIECGVNSLLIRVLKVNTRARLFYEALGGQLVLEEQIEDEGTLLDQVAYGWQDAHELLPRYVQ